MNVQMQVSQGGFEVYTHDMNRYFHLTSIHPCLLVIHMGVYVCMRCICVYARHLDILNMQLLGGSIYL